MKIFSYETQLSSVLALGGFTFFFNAFNVFIHVSDWLLYIIAATGVVVALLITIVVVVLCKRAKGEKVYR